MSTILGIWAHPDDEVFVSGGLMARAVRRGDRVVCLHMTRGEAGLSYRQPSSPDILAPIRERELRASLATLGVDEQRFLNFPDGALHRIPEEDGIEYIGDALEEFGPDVVVTFGRDGFTGHPDHKVLSDWVTEAMRRWHDPRARLYQPVVSRSWRDSFVPALNELDFFWPGHPVVTPRVDTSVDLDDELLEVKIEALRAHASQMEPLFDSYGDRFMGAMAAAEHFTVTSHLGSLVRSPRRQGNSLAA